MPFAESSCCRRFVTYARELGAAVTALGDSAALLDVKDAELTTGSLGDSGKVGGGVVAAAPSLLAIQCPIFKKSCRQIATTRGSQAGGK